MPPKAVPVTVEQPFSTTVADLPSPLSEHLSTQCNFTYPTTLQAATLPAIIDGEDTLVSVGNATGLGASTAWVIAAVDAATKPGAELLVQPDNTTTVAFPTVLLLLPTRETSLQNLDLLRIIGSESDIRSVCVFGGAPTSEQVKELQQGCDILVGTPGRFLDLCERDLIDLTNIRLVVLDDVDRMMDMGFEPQLRKILNNEKSLNNMPPIDHRQTVVICKNFPSEVKKFARDVLKTNHKVYIHGETEGGGKISSCVCHQVIAADNDDVKNEALLEVITSHPNSKIVIFANTKSTINEVHAYLQDRGINAERIHGDRHQGEREEALDNFTNGSSNVFIASDVASRGLKLPNVPIVVQYTLPTTFETYQQRARFVSNTVVGGDAADNDDGGKSVISFFSSDADNNNDTFVNELVDYLLSAGQVVPQWLQALKDEQETK